MLLVWLPFLGLLSVVLYQVVGFMPQSHTSMLKGAKRTASVGDDARGIHSPATGINSLTSLSTPSLHHIAIRTQNITRAISFYSMLLSVDDDGTESTSLSVTKFRAGPARAAWLEASFYRLELIEIPRWILEGEATGKLFRAPDLMAQNSILGYNHAALDVSIPLADFIQRLQEASFENFQKTVRVAVKPYTQIIGQAVYELAFVYDADGSLIELLHRQSIRNGTSLVGDPWAPWNGTNFKGQR